MALPGSQRRGQRRRLLMAWSRKTAPTSRGGAASARTMADYDPVALPERQPAVAMLLPTHLGRLAAYATGIILAMAAVLTPGLHEPAFSTLGRVAGPRFARSVAAAAACFDAGTMLSLAGWLAQMLLLLAAIVALVVRFMRRHRRDDFAGRYRAWGWLACLFVAASCTAQAPVGRAVGTFMTEATGIACGPAGYGWWVVITATLLGGVSLWAVVPLHERVATALWLVAGLGAWAVSAAATWLGTERSIPPGVGPAAWAAGSSLMTIAMLVAARSVIREVRGEAGGGKAAATRPQPANERPTTVVQQADWGDEPQESPAWSSDDSSSTGYTDGSDADEDRETRHLSKAERKRLKKLARMNRVA
ncbi:MAG: hypothetical protein WCR51_10200 [Planctomycetia bacterium]